MAEQTNAKGLVLVAGATGILGREVATHLHEEGYRVRAFSRNPARAQALSGIADEIVTGDATKLESLKGILDGVDAIISCLGARMGFAAGERLGGERRSFHATDTVANRNLVWAAKDARIGRFVYVSVHTQPDYAQTANIRAHEEVISELCKSRISFGVVRPTGIFPIFNPFLDMARRGTVWMAGDGRAITNPVHPRDVAEACVEVLTLGNGVCISVGGPDILTREDIARMAFEAVGEKPRVIHIPSYSLLITAALARPFHAHLAEVLEFGTRAFTSEFIAPMRGRRRLADHFAKVAASGAEAAARPELRIGVAK